MRRLMLVTMFATFVASVASAQKAPSSGGARADSEFVTLERRWNEAFKNRDGAALDRILAPDFVFTDDEGHTFTKAEYIDAVLRLVKVGSYQLSDIAVRVHGTTAVVTGLWTGSFSIDGVDGSGALRYTDTFIKTSGTWRVLASHESRVPKAPK